jgi:phosphocarrier protein
MSKVVKKLEIKNKLGLMLVRRLASPNCHKFDAHVTVSKDGQVADGRSIMGVLTLAGTQGSKIQVEASGEDAERVVRAIEKLLDNKFNENE